MKRRLKRRRMLHLRQEHIDFFRSLDFPSERNSDQQKELSGQIHLSPQGKIESVTVLFGDEMNTTLPEGELTFHTHTVLPDKRTNKDMSTDVPSPLDLVSIGMAILFNNTQEHLIFTPNYLYTITWYTDAITRMKRMSQRMGNGSFEKWLHKQVNGTYDTLSDKVGKNYGSTFVRAWLKAMRNQGFDIRQFPRHQQDLMFQVGPESVTPSRFQVEKTTSSKLERMHTQSRTRGIFMLALAGLALASGVAIYLTQKQKQQQQLLQ